VKGYNVVLVGYDRGQLIDSHPNLVNCIGKTKDMNDLCNIIKRSKGYVGVDSLPLHIANMYGIPNTSIWNVTEPIHVVGKYSQKHNIVTPGNKLTCYPCYLDHCSYSDCKQYSCWFNMIPQDIVDQFDMLMN
jgi:ADP-heptose:LPS heptosyltransferase